MQFFLNFCFFGSNHNILWVEVGSHPKKAQHLVVSPNLRLGRNFAIIRLSTAVPHRNTNRSTAAVHPASRIASRVPCQVNNAQLKPSRWETAVKRVVCTTDELTARTAQRTYHSTVHRKRVPKSRVAYEGQVER